MIVLVSLLRGGAHVVPIATIIAPLLLPVIQSYFLLWANGTIHIIDTGWCQGGAQVVPMWGPGGANAVPKW